MSNDGTYQPSNYDWAQELSDKDRWHLREQVIIICGADDDSRIMCNLRDYGVWYQGYGYFAHEYIDDWRELPWEFMIMMKYLIVEYGYYGLAARP